MSGVVVEELYQWFPDWRYLEKNKLMGQVPTSVILWIHILVDWKQGVFLFAP